MEAREIKFRLWNEAGASSKYFYDAEQVLECLKQQSLFNENPENVLGYNHIGDGSSFEQFTGLKDKNGKEIYEGDEVKSNGDRRVYQVKYSDKDASFVLMYNNGIIVYNINASILEIIGNIHETP